METIFTHLSYLDNSFLLDSPAQVVGVLEAEGGLKSVVTDRTIFYPQGGGQPYDQGFIENGNGKFDVKEVRFKEGVVYHLGNFISGNFNPGEQVQLIVNRDRRMLNCRLHTAGHLVDVAMQQAGYQMPPNKGYHFPDSPYVEYAGAIPAEQREEVLKKVQEAADKLVAENLTVSARLIEKENLKDHCYFVPDYIPKDKPSRVVFIGGANGCPCGGTHVGALGEIGAVKIKKIQVKGGNTRVSYSIG
jgi:Ser-tRNA(Ala) deacylase AlaX